MVIYAAERVWPSLLETLDTGQEVDSPVKMRRGGNEGGDGCLSFQTLLSVTHSASLLPFTLIFLTYVFVFVSVFQFAFV